MLAVLVVLKGVKMGSPFKNSVVHIDMDNLDREWADLPEDIKEACDMLADAKYLIATREAKLKLTEAELSSTIRLNPERFGIQKVTEAAIELAIPQQRTYKRILLRLNKAKRKADYIKSVVSALEAKKKALEDSVFMWSAGYFGKPKDKTKGVYQYDRDVRKPLKRGK